MYNYYLKENKRKEKKRTKEKKKRFIFRDELLSEGEKRSMVNVQ